MNLRKIMNLQLLRSLVTSSPRLAGGNSFTHWAFPLKSLTCLRTLWLVLWFLTPCECLGIEAASSRSLSRQPLLHWVTNAILLLGKSWFFDSPFLAVFLYSAAWNKARQRCCYVVSQDLKRQPSSTVSIDVGRAALCILLALQNTPWVRERVGKDHGGIWAQIFCLGEQHMWAASFWEVCGHLGGIFSHLHSSGKACFIQEDWSLRFLSN